MKHIETKFLFLVAVRNRKQLTLSILQFLEDFAKKNSLKFQFLVVDDASSDGTAKAVRESFPSIEVLDGNGSLYWAGAMRFGFEHIEKNSYEYDYLIAFNDDIRLDYEPTLNFFSELEANEILVGAFQSSCGKITYGGRNAIGRWPLNFGPVAKNDLGRRVKVANFNFIAIPRRVLKKMRLIDYYFIHNSADYDFSLRALRNGFSIRMASVILGNAERNLTANTSADSSLSPITRMQRLFSVKEYPLRQRFLFCKAHGGASWFLWFIRPYIGFCYKLLRFR